VPQIDIFSLAVMVVTMAVNILVMRYEYARGRELKSSILVSDSLHTRADIFTSASVILAMAFVSLGFPLLDPVITTIISLFIAYAAISIVRESSNVLCDAVIVDEKNISRIVLSVKGVRTCHKIRTRGMEDDIHVDLHVQVDPGMHIDKAHQISYQIEGAIKSGIQGVTDVVVHMEPKK
jgi:cation diffusion facilitator family transporter